MAATTIQTYLGEDVAANMPSAPDIPVNTIAFYYATDTQVLSFYDQSTPTWNQLLSQAANGTINASASVNYNLAMGTSCGPFDDNSINNTGVGGWIFTAGSSMNGASGNTAIGTFVLQSLTTGAFNTAIGYGCLGAVTTGNYNIGIGGYAVGEDIIAGSSNILIGSYIGSSDTSYVLNIGNLVLGDLQNLHVSYGGANPSVSGGSLDSYATDTSGTVTASDDTIVITFAEAYGTFNHCMVTAQGGPSVVFTYSYTLSAITITGISLSGQLFDYRTDGN